MSPKSLYLLRNASTFTLGGVFLQLGTGGFLNKSIIIKEMSNMKNIIMDLLPTIYSFLKILTLLYGCH